MFDAFIKKYILGDLFSINLTSGEKIIASKSVAKKYSIALKKTVIHCLVAVLPILFLDTTVLISVLIPITMVAGTAWFSISLANMKQKFEGFGLELTKNMFEAFSVSLGLLFILSVASLSSPFWKEAVQALPHQELMQGVSCVLGIVVIGNIIAKIFIGSMQYDINDAMLTGQNEAAERYYRRALSLLHSVAGSLKGKKSLHVANYHIGVAFFEIFSYVKSLGVLEQEMDSYIEKTNTLIKNPSMKQEEADALAHELINAFMQSCKEARSNDAKKGVQAIQDELWCLKNNKNEDQEMVDTRLSVVFEEIANIIEMEGETLFK